MYEKLGITENHLQALGLFTHGFNREYYIREVQKILEISPRTAQLILDDLEKKAVLESRIRGKIRNYAIKKSEIAKHYFVLAETYKRISFLENNPIILEIVEKISPNISGISMIFGSYAKGNQKKGSDIDIFVAGTYKKEEIAKISTLYGIEINIKNYPMNVFLKAINDDILITEVLVNHIMITGAEELIDLVI